LFYVVFIINSSKLVFLTIYCSKREDSERNSRSCFDKAMEQRDGNTTTNLHDRAFCLPKE